MTTCQVDMPEGMCNDMDGCIGCNYVENGGMAGYMECQWNDMMMMCWSDMAMLPCTADLAGPWGEACDNHEACIGGGFCAEWMACEMCDQCHSCGDGLGGYCG